MMSVPPSGVLSAGLSSDRSSVELRAYLRDEHRAGVGWLDHMLRSKSAPREGRLRRWLAARRSRRENASLGPSLEVVPQTVRPPRTADAEACLHSVTEDLGLGGSAGFLRCGICGDVIVVRGASQWRIRSAAAEAVAAPEDSIPADPAKLY